MGETRKGTINSFGEVRPALIAFLNDKNNKIIDGFLQKAEQATTLKREQLAYAACAVLALYLMFGSAAELVCNSIGFVYPAYASMKVAKGDAKDDNIQWLAYWIIYSAASLLDFFSQSIMDFVPLYWLAKIIFLLFLSLPHTNGAEKMYKRYLVPIFTRFDEAFFKKK